MVNCITLWGNRRLIPRGPLREHLIALRQVDIIVLHHTDLISKEKYQYIMAMLECLLEEKSLFLIAKWSRAISSDYSAKLQ